MAWEQNHVPCSGFFKFPLLLQRTGKDYVDPSRNTCRHLQMQNALVERVGMKCWKSGPHGPCVFDGYETNLGRNFEYFLSLEPLLSDSMGLTNLGTSCKWIPE